MVQCCFTSTETTRLIRDGEPRTATSTLTQLLNSGTTVTVTAHVTCIHSRHVTSSRPAPPNGQQNVSASLNDAPSRDRAPERRQNLNCFLLHLQERLSHDAPLQKDMQMSSSAICIKKSKRRAQPLFRRRDKALCVGSAFNTR